MRLFLLSYRLTAVLLACSALALGGCASSAAASFAGSASGATTATTLRDESTETMPPALARALASVRGRTLRANEMNGFTPGRRVFARTAQRWVVASQVARSRWVGDAARLQRLGFVKAVRENLATSAGQQGLSIVEQFQTAAAARAELVYETSRALSGTPMRFAVAGIAGARGFAYPEGGANVAFVKGPYYYLVGAAVAGRGGPGPSLAKTRAIVIRGARHLYRRVSA
jgi:hypothetical protein